MADLVCPTAQDVVLPYRTADAKMSTVGLSKTYGTTTALHPINLDVRDGELLTLLGPSGSGKTTLLQIICGLVEPTAGQLYIDSVERTYTPAHERDIGVVFQNYALFPHLTVYENIAFPLQMRRVDAGAIKKRVTRSLGLVGLEQFSKRFPRELSGGQQQRVALARCLVYEPSILLMDESLSALDRKLREAMQIEIKRIHRETGSTIIFVTHDQEEALALSDRICLMNVGRIEQIGTPEEIYEFPSTTFAADFIGITNKLKGRIKDDGFFESTDGLIPLPKGNSNVRGWGDVVLVVRPESITVRDEGGFISGTIVEKIYAGSETRFLVRLSSGTTMTVRQSASDGVTHVGATVSLCWEVENSRLLRD